jgi:hypothetical protein
MLAKMKKIAFAVLLGVEVSLFSQSVPEKVDAPSRNTVTCDFADAEQIVRIRYRFQGVIGDTEKIEYVRLQRVPRLISKNADGSEIWDVDGGKFGAVVGIADGKTNSGAGIGYSSSLVVQGKGSGVILRFSLHWKHEGDSGDFEREWELPLQDTKLSAGRFSAEIRVEKKANQSLQPTAPSGRG